MNDTLKNDPRLKNMDKDRLELLLSFARTLEKTPQNQKMQTLLSMNQTMAARGLTFSPEETDLLFSILTESLSPSEKKRAQMIRNLSRTMAKKS